MDDVIELIRWAKGVASAAAHPILES